MAARSSGSSLRFNVVSLRRDVQLAEFPVDLLQDPKLVRIIIHYLLIVPQPSQVLHVWSIFPELPQILQPDPLQVPQVTFLPP